MRIFQTKVDPALGKKPLTQIVAEQQAAEYIASVSAAPAADPVAQVAKIHAVAAPLSESLGIPKTPTTAADSERIIAALRAGKLAEQDRAEKWRAFALKYGGKPIEGTGINLAGTAGIVGFVLVVAAVVAFPPLGYILLRVLPLLWGYFKQTSAAIEHFVASGRDPDEKLRGELSSKMDQAQKTLIRRRFGRQKAPTPA